MASLKTANRYAKGLIQFAQETKQAEKVYNEMGDILKSVRENEELRSFLKTPILDEKKKEKIAKEIFKDFSKTTQTFICLVIRQGRENILGLIAFQYIMLYDQANKIYQAILTSAEPLSDDISDHILNKAKQIIGTDRTYTLHKLVRPDLIGGFKLRVGDKMIDASLRTRLNKIKKELEDYNYIPNIK